MIDWYIEISDWAPDSFKCDECLAKVIDTATPFMDYFCKRLSELTDWKLEDANKLFSEIVDEMPIMTTKIQGDEFIINYNKWIFIKLTETPKQIYRDSKIKQLLA
jgi:hypothetical protein